jgi:hypothetical protein
LSRGARPRGGVPRRTREPGRERHERGNFWDRLHDKWHDTSCPIRPGIRPADRVAIARAPTPWLTVDVVSSLSSPTMPGLGDVTGIGRLPENPAEAGP